MITNKINTKKKRTLKIQGMIVVFKKSHEETESDFDESSTSDFESLLGSMYEDNDLCEDVDDDSNIERSVAATRSKTKGKVVFTNKG